MSQQSLLICPQQTLSSEVLVPPVPPIEITPEFIPGEFAYIPQGRQYLQDAYRVISINEWWGAFKDYLLTRGVSKTTGFMFTTDPFYNNIMNEIASTPIGGGHSGGSMVFCMRVMEEIALNGEAEYRKKHIDGQSVRNICSSNIGGHCLDKRAEISDYST